MEEVPKFDYVDRYIDEKELINRLVIGNDHKLNYSLFTNVIHKPFPEQEYREYTGFYVGTNILRSDMAFDRNSKPGDFDILIIPFSSNDIYFSRTAVFEVKVVRPTRKKPKRNSNSMGETQIYGLIKDGFPLIGLIHICMTEPLKEHEKQKLKFITGGIGEDASKVPFNDREIVEIEVDGFSMWACTNQFKRLISREIPKYVGLFTCGLNARSDGSFSVAISHHFNNYYDAAYFNPNTSDKTIEKVKYYWENHKDKFIAADA